MPDPLPEPLASRPFTFSEGRDAGVTPWRLRSRDLHRPHLGVRAAASSPRAAAFAPLLRPGDRFSHSTAVALWGAPIPATEEELIHVTVPAGRQPPRRPGVIGHVSRGERHVIRQRMPVSDPLTAFRECATILRLDDLVAVGDHLILDPRQLDPDDLRPYLTLKDLRAGLLASSGRGVRAARSAADLVRPGVESRRETLLRLLLHRAQIPEPVCGYELLDGRGRRIGWFDLAWPQHRVIAEYDGDQHRTSRAQYERDIRRFDRASDAGWRVIRVRSRGLGTGASETVDRVRRALARAGEGG